MSTTCNTSKLYIQKFVAGCRQIYMPEAVTRYIFSHTKRRHSALYIPFVTAQLKVQT